MSLEIVNAFMRAAAARDYDTARSLVTEDVEYQNMMLPPVHGKDAMVATMDALLALCSDSTWDVLREVSSGSLVMNERIDRFTINGLTTELPVAGIFELRDGLIAVWHDYFDLQTIMAAMPS